MNSARVLREARRRAGLSQRELEARTGVPQSAIAKIETGRVVPRVDTLDRLLAGCDESLTAIPRLGIGVDRTLIHSMLRLTPDERLQYGEQAARGLMEIRKAARK